MQIHLTTLIFEIVNFVVLVWLLRRLLYRPLRAAITERENALAAERTQSQTVLQAAHALEQQWRDKNRELAALADEVRARALAEAASEQGAMLTRAREEAAAERRKAEALLHAEREAAESWVRATAIERSTELAGEMLIKLAPESVEAALASRLIEELQARGAELVPHEDASEPPLDVEVAAAQAPSPDTIEALRAELTKLLGGAPRFAMHEDPSLRAGLQLRIGDRLLDASLAGKLQAFSQLARELAEGRADG